MHHSNESALYDNRFFPIIPKGKEYNKLNLRMLTQSNGIYVKRANPGN